jgi:hypothetical protein
VNLDTIIGNDDGDTVDVWFICQIWLLKMKSLRF